MKNHLLRILGVLTFAASIFSTACKDDEKIAVETVTLTPTALSLKVGETRKIEAAVLPENAENKTIVWNSDDGATASVDTEGVVTALKSGQTTVRAAAGNITAACAVTVYTEVESIRLEPTEITLKTGESAKIEATILPDDAINKTLIWKSSDTATATVDSDGNVTALKAGQAVVEALAGSVRATCTVSVESEAVHPLSLYAEYNVGPTAGSFALSHTAEDAGYFNFTDAQNACPAGWHLPDESEMYSAVDCWDRDAGIQHCVFTGKSNYTDIPERIRVDGQLRDFTADYFTDVKNYCYALKFKDATGDYLSAYRWTNASNGVPFEVRARWLKGADKNLTISDIAKEEFWNESNENDIVRLFPAVGYRYANGNSSGIDMVSYCWSAIEENPTAGGSRRGLLLYFIKGNYAYTGAFAASWLCSVRCVKDN